MTGPAPQVLGIVLAGGAGRRMGGADKALVTLAGRPMIAHVLARLAPQCAAVAINAGGDPARFGAEPPELIGDAVPGRIGPLAGILAGLLWASARAPGSLLLTVPTDTPFLPSDLVARLERAMAERSAPAATAESGGRRHPTIGLWRPDLAALLRAALLERGVRRVERWAEKVGAAAVAWPTTPLDPFMNVNTTEDLARAESLLKAHPGAVDSLGGSG